MAFLLKYCLYEGLLLLSTHIFTQYLSFNSSIEVFRFFFLNHYTFVISLLYFWNDWLLSTKAKTNKTTYKNILQKAYSLYYSLL